jgi:hypothetical protein
MINKKAQTGWIVIGIVIFIILIISIITIIYINKQNNSEKEKVESKTIPFFLKATDYKTSSSKDAKFIIDHTFNDSIIIDQQGDLKQDTYTPLTLNYFSVPHIRCYSEDSYLTTTYKIVSAEEISNNISRLDCVTNKLGSIEMQAIGKINEISNDIQLNITCNDGFCQRLGLCFAWTAGIETVNTKDSISVCDSGIWKNYSYFNASTNKFTYLEKGSYLCGDEKLEKCDFVTGNKCKMQDMKIPKRLDGKVDSCTYTGKSLNYGQSAIVNLEVETTEYKNRLDYVRIIAIDSDKRYDEAKRDYIWFDEYQGQDLGIKDKEIQIDYNG